MKSIKMMIFSMVMLVASAANAIPMPDFIIYGTPGAAKQVSAYLNDSKIADATFNKGYYRLPINMDSENSYHSGDVIELWVDGQPTGTMVTIGAMGSVKQLNLSK